MAVNRDWGGGGEGGKFQISKFKDQGNFNLQNSKGGVKGAGSGEPVGRWPVGGRIGDRQKREIRIN